MVEFVIGLSIIAGMLGFHRDLMRVDFSAIAKFIGVMSIVVCVRICIASFMLDTYGISPTNSAITQHNNWALGLVFWEDAFFAIPIFLFRRHVSNLKRFWIPVVIALSLYFGHGHLYQGYYAAAIISLCPFFISYKYGMRVGFGTVMICHILYDHMVVYLQKLLPYLLN